MTPRNSTAGFTRKELLVVIAVLIALSLLLIPGLQRTDDKVKRITCVNYLKAIGCAYRIWSNDNGDHYPAFAPQTNGGWRDLLYYTNASAYCWTNYVTMANELGQSPRILICPSDQRKPADNFGNLSNINISYFVGVNANDTYPQSILGGDRNLGPGTTRDPEYGFSPANGQGNDVVINGPVCWSMKMHSRGNPAGAGNIMLGDGSAQQATSGNLYENWMKSALTEQAASNKSTNPPGVRLIFP